MRTLRHIMSAIMLLALLAGCGGAATGPLAHRPSLPASVQPAAVQSTPLATPAQPCTGTFVEHQLDHATTIAGDEIRMFEGNGAGVAIGDLDGDGLLDVALANNDAPNTILWNQGSLNFRTERLAHGDSRAANLIDVDGDGRLDMVFSRRHSGPSYWHNAGGGHFEQMLLPQIVKPIYAMNWADLNGDGALDLVAGSYDAELLTEQGNGFLLGGGAGVYYYERHGDTYMPTRLALKSQALAIGLFDLNGDGRQDIVVGNDFALPDAAWLHQGDTWVVAQPFAHTSHSTMSLDQGDIDNDGSLELFSTDMKPYAKDPQTLATWLPLMNAMWHPPQPGDPQIMENVLQVRDASGAFRNQAYERGVDATGWSWSGKFGDLDNDGFLDLYVVNGMAEAELFSYLPSHELVEQNQAFHNDGSGYFVRARAWGLGSTYGGRGMSMADLDGDGDLDIVVNNLRGPAQLLENRLCGGSSLEVELRWPASKNTRALGATLTLRTSAGDYTRDMRAASGYLSGDPPRIHIGFPDNATLERLEIRWPDGAVSVVDAPARHTLLTVTRN